jgi:RNA polymerase sigma factor (sigma-70 family)
MIAMRSYQRTHSVPADNVTWLFLFSLILALFIFDRNAPESDDEHVLDMVRRAKEGDDDAFTALFELYYAPICRHLYSIVGNMEDVYDLAAETFTRAWYRLPRIHDDKRFRGWLYKIATNVARDYIRSQSAQKRGSRPVKNFSEDASNEQAAPFENQVEEQELIRLALAKVAPKPRMCLLLYQRGFNYEEIAEIMGMRRTSVGTYLLLARKQFRKAYERLSNQE